MRFIKPKRVSTPSSVKDILPLLTFGNDEHEMRLEQPTLALGSRSTRTRQMVENLKESAAYYGVHSISANQLGLNPSVFLMAPQLMKNKTWFSSGVSAKDFKVFINPQIVEASSLKEYGWEYCVSFPNLRAKVLRHCSIQVSYYDHNFKEQEAELDDFDARVFQHECDHLQGYTLLNLEVSDGNIEQIEQEHHTPLFNKVFAEYQHYCQINKDKTNKKNRLKVDRDSDPAYWDTQQLIEQKYEEKELLYMQRMQAALAQDRNNRPSSDPNLQ